MGKTLCCKILGKRPTCASRDKRRKTKRERDKGDGQQRKREMRQ